MYRSSPFRSTLNTSCITGLDMCKVCTEAIQFRSTLNTSYITGLDMCKVCTEAVHPVALWTSYITGLDMWAAAFISVKLKGRIFYRRPLPRLKRISIPTSSSKNGDLVFQRLACLSCLMNLTKWKMMRKKIFVFSTAHHALPFDASAFVGVAEA